MTSPGARQIGLVLWNAEIGGAETFSVSLAVALSKFGVAPRFLILGGDGPLLRRLERLGLEYVVLGLRRGREIVRFPRRLAARASRLGPDGLILPECGFIGATLRFGGYRSPIIAVEHGAILAPREGLVRRMLDPLARLAGARSVDFQVAVSDHVHRRLSGKLHGHRLRRIYNGIDNATLRTGGTTRAPDREELVAGFAGRLTRGKGVDVLISAVAEANRQVPLRLLVAGDGPERPWLESLVGQYLISDRVEFVGMVDDIASFWSACDIAVVPSSSKESFCMAALEAMSCGRPLVASGHGAIPELVQHGETGILVPPGDRNALVDAMVTYASAPELREQHAAAASRRARAAFDIATTAAAYVELIGESSRSSDR